MHRVFVTLELTVDTSFTPRSRLRDAGWWDALLSMYEHGCGEVPVEAINVERARMRSGSLKDHLGADGDIVRGGSLHERHLSKKKGKT